jgi:TATA-binding protein-associated factor Taf7
MNEESEEEDDGDGELNDEDLKQLMAAMDRELSKTNIGKSFERVPKAARQKNDEDDSSDDEEEGEVDPKLNLVKNFLDSYAAQEGMAGPVTNLLNELGRKAKK